MWLPKKIHKYFFAERNAGIKICCICWFAMIRENIPVTFKGIKKSEK
jgi:hypothetical protein